MSPEQTHLEAGIACFNAGEYFAAHEHWEVDWQRLPAPDKAQMQAAILVCGVFVLLQKGRLEPAVRLAKLAIERFAEAVAESRLLGVEPFLDLPDAEDQMLQFLARVQVPGFEARAVTELVAEFSEGLRAHLRTP